MTLITQCTSFAEVRDSGDRIDRLSVMPIAQWSARAALHPPSPTKN